MRKQSRGFRAQLSRIASELWCGSAGWEQEREELLAKITGLEKNLAKETKWVKTFENALPASRQEVLGHELALDIERTAWTNKFFELTNKITAQESVLYEVDKRRIELIKLSESRRIQLIVVSAALFVVSVLNIVEMCVGVA